MAQSRLTFWKCHGNSGVREMRWNWLQKCFSFFSISAQLLTMLKKNSFIMIRIRGGGVLLCVLFNPICTLLLLPLNCSLV